MSIELVKKLREMTNAGFADCKTAIEEAKGNLDDAVKFLREKGKSAAGKKSGRETANGLVGSSHV